MNIAKTIKQQALSYLSKDNWATAVGGFFIICLPAILIILFQGTAVSALELFWDFDNLTLTQGNILILFEFLLIGIYILTTPMITGYLKLCYNISNGEKADIGDVFYYYRNKCFGKCLSLNLKIMVRVILHFLLVVIPALFMASVFAVTQNVIIFVLAILLLSAAIIETLFYSVKYTVVPVIMFEDESLDAGEAFYLGTNFIKERLGCGRTLLFTFFPYFLLCFFVIPWIFVFPYLTVSFMTNSKWISELHKVNPKSSCNTQQTP